MLRWGLDPLGFCAPRCGVLRAASLSVDGGLGRSVFDDGHPCPLGSHFAFGMAFGSLGTQVAYGQPRRAWGGLYSVPPMSANH